MKKLILIALVGSLFACAQVQRDGGRALDNANSVVTSGGKKVWSGGDHKSSSCGCSSCKDGGSCNADGGGSSCGSSSCSDRHY